MGRRAIAAAAAALFSIGVAGCTGHGYQYGAQGYSLPEPMPSSEGPKRLNSNWKYNCTNDAVRSERRCFVGTFGDLASSSGEIVSGQYAKNVAPFQLYFINQVGPYIKAGRNTYPGREPTIRIGEGRPINVEDDSLISENILQEILSGNSMLVRYHIWPEGRRDMIVDLTGVKEAWEKLQELSSS